MARYIDADRLIDDLKHDVAIDQDSLDYEELTDSNREKIQFDKDCKQNAIDLLQHAPTIEPERKKGKWTEKHHAYSDEENPIEEWQSCKCSECGRYDTRPYLYYFSEPNYCSYCGADMRTEGKDDN